jgi:putative acetyltransferase
MKLPITIFPFSPDHASQVRELFIMVNRLLSPPHLPDAFGACVMRSLTEEMDRIVAYYGERDGGFWVVPRENTVVGMFGLERVGPDALELWRMYVDPSARRSGIVRQMLLYAETECRCRVIHKLELSTSELQDAALAVYRDASYVLIREEIVVEASAKTVGRGIRRYYFEKTL